MVGAAKKGKRQNIFTKYFCLFIAIFLVCFIVLGMALVTIVNGYSLKDKTALLSENTQSIANYISQNMIVNNMNSTYS